MSRLLVSTFIRMLKKVIFWFFVLCMFAYGVYSALNIASEARIGFVLDGCPLQMDGIFSVGDISNFCFGNCPVSEKRNSMKKRQ